MVCCWESAALSPTGSSFSYRIKYFHEEPFQLKDSANVYIGNRIRNLETSDHDGVAKIKYLDSSTLPKQRCLCVS